MASKGSALCAMVVSLTLVAPFPASGQQKTAPSPKAKGELRERSWTMLQEGVQEKDWKKRAQALHAMGVMRPEPQTIKMLEGAMDDKSPEVRVAAASSLGEMHATSSIPRLQAAVDDKDFGVSVAAAAALVMMKNDAGYDADYEMLTGQRKSGEPLTQQAQSMLHDRDKMMLVAFEEGMGFVPFGGIGVAAFTTLTQGFRRTDSRECSFGAGARSRPAQCQSTGVWRPATKIGSCAPRPSRRSRCAETFRS